MSKSVRERRTEAPIGRRKNKPITRRPGARKMSAARTSLDRRGPGGRRTSITSSAATLVSAPSREHPAPLLQDPIDVRVDRGERRRKSLAPADGGLEAFRHVLGDLLPLGDPRHRRDPLDLDAERAGLLVPCESRVVPRRARGGKVAGERVE